MGIFKISYLGRQVKIEQKGNGKFVIPDFIQEQGGMKYGLQCAKPALEPIAVFQKPHLKPMIKNVEKWGCGAMNIEHCRVDNSSQDDYLKLCQLKSLNLDVLVVALKNGQLAMSKKESVKFSAQENACINILEKIVGKPLEDILQSMDTGCLEKMLMESISANLNTSTFGKSATSKKSQKASTSITKTEINKTTESKTSNYYQEKITLDSIKNTTQEKMSLQQGQDKRENIEQGLKKILKDMQNILEKRLKEKPKRHPSNLIHDGSESVEAEFLRQGGITKSGGKKNSSYTNENDGIFTPGGQQTSPFYGSSGSCSRYFNSLPITQDDFVPFKYCAKASKRERNEGLEGMPEKPTYTEENPTPMRDHRMQVYKQNHHPTTKPIALMEWLIKLVTPPGGIVLDPFMGSGTTGIAAKKNGFRFLGIEKEEEYYIIAEARINDSSTTESQDQIA